MISLLGRNPFCMVYFVQINVRCVVLVKDIKGCWDFRGEELQLRSPVGQTEMLRFCFLL